MRVLISAYACRPGYGSERGVGWNWVMQMARFHEVWVITRKCEQEAIEEFQMLEPNTITWIFHDLPFCERLLTEGGKGVHFYYYFWQIAAYLKARHLNKAFGLDVTHHLTYGGYWMPSFLVFLPVPFIWGPVGGAEAPPKSFVSNLGFKFRCFEKLRKAVQKIGEKDPSVQQCIRGSAVALTKADETALRLRKLGASCVKVYPESGLTKEEIKELGNIPVNISRPFRFLSMGRLLNWKQFDLGLKAFSKFYWDFKDCEYWIVGDGPEFRRLKQLTQDLNIHKVTRFFGRIPRQEAFEKLISCHVLVHPSLHDSGGWVCLEAMAAGRPVVCLNLGGPAIQVTAETGFMIKADTPEQVVRDMCCAFRRLEQDKAFYHRMSSAGRKRVREHFEWDQKGKWINLLYCSIIEAEARRDR